MHILILHSLIIHIQYFNINSYLDQAVLYLDMYYRDVHYQYLRDDIVQPDNAHPDITRIVYWVWLEYYLKLVFIYLPTFWFLAILANNSSEPINDTRFTRSPLRCGYLEKTETYVDCLSRYAYFVCSQSLSYHLPYLHKN